MDTSAKLAAARVPRIPPVLAFVTLVVGAMAFVVGFLWSDAIRATIDALQERYPDVDPLVFKYTTALLVTCLVTFLGFVMHWSLRAYYGNKL